MITSSPGRLRPAAERSPTWYMWLCSGLYVYLVNVQGNVVPFLQAEFALSYRAVSLHSSAIAAGVILVGLFGDWLARRVGRRVTVWLGLGGLAGGSILLCLSPAPWASLTSCFLIGALGALLPAIIPAILADLHGPRQAQVYASQAVVSYVFGLAAPLATGAALWLGLGWRASVLLGAFIAIGVALAFRKVPIVAPVAHAHHDTQSKLPPAYWAYFLLLVFGVALEFGIIFWAPAFLERVIALSPATAATAAAGFPLGMLIGRGALRYLVARVAPRRLLPAALALVFLGFLVYWGVGMQAQSAVAAVLGVFLLGLGVASLYPLATNFAVDAAPRAKDLASMRLAIAFGLSLLAAPIALGALADEVGLGAAHLALPVLIVAALLSFFAGEALQRKAERVAA